VSSLAKQAGKKKDVLECSKVCNKDPTCSYFQYNKDKKDQRCLLFTKSLQFDIRGSKHGAKPSVKANQHCFVRKGKSAPVITPHAPISGPPAVPGAPPVPAPVAPISGPTAVKGAAPIALALTVNTPKPATPTTVIAKTG